MVDISPFFSTLAQKRKISVEESSQEILDSKSIARATSCFVENAKIHNAFPHKSLPASAKRLPAVSPTFARSKKPRVGKRIYTGTSYRKCAHGLKPALHAYFFLRAGGAEKPGRSSAQERFYERTFRTREEGFSRECFRAREDAILWKD